MATINRKTRNQLRLNSTRIRFEVRKLKQVSLLNVAMKVLLSLFIAIPSIGLFHTVSSIVIFDVYAKIFKSVCIAFLREK